MKTKYLKWVDDNIKNINKSNIILVLGATGSIGGALCEFLAYKECHLILGAKDLKAVDGLKNQLDSTYKNKNEIQIVDFLNQESIQKLINFIKENKIYYIVNTIGIYHQLPMYLPNGFEKTYFVNYVAPAYLFTKIFQKNPDIKILQVGSISYHYKKLDFNNLYGKGIKIRTLIYSYSKRLIMSYCTYLKENGFNVIIAHPGISTTNLFNPKNKAYNKAFYKLIVPTMKVIFMNKYKASLSLLKALDINDLNYNKWIGPRGFSHSWGYPNEQKLTKRLCNSDNLNKINKHTEEVIKQYENSFNLLHRDL